MLNTHIRSEEHSNPNQKYDVVESLSVEKHGLDAFSVEHIIVVEPEQDGLLEKSGIYCAVEEVKSAAVASAALALFGLQNVGLLTKLCGCQRELQDQNVGDLEQTTTTDHFNIFSTEMMRASSIGIPLLCTYIGCQAIGTLKTEGGCI